MAKQNIYIGTKSGNRRIERAIPRLMGELGVKKDQATAIAIRLESLGRLEGSGEPMAKGGPGRLAALAASQMMKRPQQKRTEEKVAENIEATTTRQYRYKLAKIRAKKPRKK